MKAANSRKGVSSALSHARTRRIEIIMSYSDGASKSISTCPLPCVSCSDVYNSLCITCCFLYAATVMNQCLTTIKRISGHLPTRSSMCPFGGAHRTLPGSCDQHYLQYLSTHPHTGVLQIGVCSTSTTGRHCHENRMHGENRAGDESCIRCSVCFQHLLPVSKGGDKGLGITRPLQAVSVKGPVTVWACVGDEW